MGLLPRKVILANTPQAREEEKSPLFVPIPGLLEVCHAPALPQK